MENLQVNSIYFVETKAGNVAAIVNNEFSVVRNSSGNFNIYKSLTNGSPVENSQELVSEFSTAFINHFQKLNEKIIRERQAKEQAEKLRIENLIEKIKGVTPQDFAETFNIQYVETAAHWSDLYEERSSFAFIIRDAKELELVQIADSVNNWGGQWGELKRRDGAHHSEFDEYFNIEDYQKRIERYFDEKFMFHSQESDQDYLLDRIKEASDIEEVKTILEDFENLVAGYYNEGGNLVIEGDNFNDFFGYCYDVYTYNFGYRFLYKSEFYGEMEIKE